MLNFSMQIRGLDGRTICGRRARVEMSNGSRGFGGRGPPPRSRLPPRPYDDRCYDCGDRGHYARDCTRRRRRRLYIFPWFVCKWCILDVFTKKNQGMESSILQENHFLCICFTWKSLKGFVNIKIPFHCFGLTYTNDNYVIGYHWPVRRERTRQCLHFLLSALRSFHFAACTPIKLAASVTSLCELHSYRLRAHFTSRQLHWTLTFNRRVATHISCNHCVHSVSYTLLSRFCVQWRPARIRILIFYVDLVIIIVSWVLNRQELVTKF